MLETALLPTENPNRLGPLPHPLAGMVFHYDKFSSFSRYQPCEAAYLCSTGIPVKVLVSPASYEKMKRIYSNLPGIPEKFKPTVRPMLFEQQHLNASRMMKLMAVEGADGTMPLYMEVRTPKLDVQRQERLPIPWSGMKWDYPLRKFFHRSNMTT